MKQMKDRCFIDTNIWVYLYSDTTKSIVVNQIIETNFEDIVISTQVMTELYNVLVKKKFKTRIEAAQIINEISRTFTVCGINSEMVIKASEISIKFQYSIYDSLIIATALSNQCNIVYTEDLQHNQTIEQKIKIIDPFKKI